MRFEGGSRAGFVICAVVLFCGIFAGTTNAASEIYYNINSDDWVYAPGNGAEVIDYGTTSEGGKVTQFTFGYAANHYGSRTATVRFYKGTDYYSTGRDNLLATFNISLQVPSTVGWHTKTYSIPTNNQFNLESGEFGYSLEFNDDQFYVVLAEDGTGNENYLWMYFFDLFWDLANFSPSGDPYAGIYMSILADPPAEPTRVSGYKFDDADGNGVWDGGEDVLEGWRIYIDENENGTWEATEPNDITDPNGYYEFLDLPAGSITVAEVMQEGWTQTLPGGTEETYQLDIEANEQYENNNFGNTDEPVVTDVTVSGYVTQSGGGGLEGILVDASGTAGGSTTTDQNGYYEFTFPVNPWTGSITPSDEYWSFSPASRGYSGLTSDRDDVDFTGTSMYSYVILHPVADAYVKSTDPDANFGSSTSLTVGKSSTTIYRTFLKFDMSQVPDGYQIVSASLELQANYVPPVDVEVGAWQTSEGWTESEITWNNQRTPYDELPVDSGVVSSGTNSWDVTQDADNTYCYDRELSILLQSTNEALAYYTGFWSKETAGDSVPRLVVYYAQIFGGGKGTPDDPFQIWTDEQMNTIGLLSNRWDQSYKLMDDIVMTGYTGSNYNQIGTWSSSPPLKKAFSGVFDGNGHTISGFQAGSLFDYVRSGRIQNLGLIGPVVSDDGAFVDRLEWGDISDCWVDGGSVDGGSDVGGLVGYLDMSNLAGCWSSATVSGTDFVGGLVGTSYRISHIQNSYAAGNVTGQDYVGGFVGYAYSSAIVNCYSSGVVNGISDVGGFCGYTVAGILPGETAYNCFWDTDINGTTSAMGTGKTTADMKTLSTFTDAGWDFVDETANGRNDDWAIPAGSYPVLWYQLPTPPALPGFAGGNGTQGNPYLIATVDQLNSIGHNRRLMDKHFRLINDLDLAGQPFTMIADGAYAFMGSFDGNNHCIKNMSISIPTYHCNIGFVGNNYGGHISNLTLRNADIQAEYARYVGSITGMNRTGLVENCHSQNMDVTGFVTVGGLVGANYWHANISRCSVIGRVEESAVMSFIMTGVGGLVGENIWWSTIEYSGANVDVIGEESVGGLVGNNLIFAKLTDCYAIGTVTATDDRVGGLASRSGGTNYITRCYAACEISAPAEAQLAGVMVGSEGAGTYTDCFWDNQINGALPGFGNTNSSTVLIDTVGETTANMQMAATYQGQDWDFDTVWKICENTNYPRLILEAEIPGDIACPDGVGIEDFGAVAAQWQLSKLIADISPNGGDGIINLADFARMASAWLSVSPEDAFDQVCDIAPPGGNNQIGVEDIQLLAEQWLQKSAHSAELATGIGDRSVNMLDWSVFAGAWQSITAEPNFEQRCDLADPEGYIEVNDLAVFAGQWLMTGKNTADIAPNNINTVGYEDLVIIAENWLVGR